MIEAPSTQPLSGALLRRTFAFVDEPAPDHGSESAIASGWREDLRFFAGAYVLALIFFLLVIA